MSRNRFLILVALMLAGIFAMVALGLFGNPFTAAGYRPLKLPFAEFPERIGSWEGSDRPLDERAIQIAGMDTYLRREYRNPEKGTVLFYMCYYGNKERGLQTIYHNPTVCFPAAGWKPVRSSRRKVTLTDAARQFDVSLDRFQASARRLVVLNFFVIDGEILEEPPRNKPFWLALEKLKPSSDPGYFAQVQVIADARGDAGIAERRAVGFLEEAGQFIFHHF